jgi:hypothetical protein
MSWGESMDKHLNLKNRSTSVTIVQVAALGGVSLLALILAILLRFIPIGYLDFDSAVLTDGTMSKSLKSGDEEAVEREIKPSMLAAFSPLFERAGAIFGGEEKVQINDVYPVFTDDGAAVMCLDDKAKLITTDIVRKDTYRDLFLSDGYTFNRDRTRADSEIFILLEMPGEIYLNAMSASVKDRKIPMNSTMFFSKDSLAYYFLEDGAFRYGRVDGLGEYSTIQIGDERYNYYDLLRSLGLLQGPPKEPLPLPDPPEEEIEIADDTDETNPGTEGVPAPATGVPEAPEAPLPAGGSSYYRPSVHLSTMQCFVEEGTGVGLARGNLSVLDRSGAVLSDVTVYLYKGEFLLDTHVMPRATFQGKGAERVSEQAVFRDLIEGTEYRVYGEYSYRDKNGNTQTMIFDDRTFVFKKPEKAEHPIPPGYVKPEVTLGQFTGEPYFVRVPQTVNDPAGRITGGVKYEVYRISDGGTKIYMRKSMNGTRDVRIGFLPPDEKYRVEVSYIYLNERNEQIKVNLGEHEVSTLPIPTDRPISLNFANGDIFSKRIQLEDVFVRTDISNPILVEAMDRIAVVVNDKEHFVNKKGVVTIKAGEETVVETANVLATKTEYDYEWVCYDPFGTKLPMKPPVTGTTRTCSDMPKADLSLTVAPGNTGFGIKIQNKDLVDVSDCRVTFYELHDGVETLVETRAVTADPPGYGPAVTSHAISEAYTTNGAVYQLNIANLRLDTAYVIKVTGDFDIGDGRNYAPNPRDDEEMLSKRFAAAPLSALGYVSFNTVIGDPTDATIIDPTDETATLHENVNTYATLEVTRNLLSQVTFDVYEVDGDGDLSEDPVHSVVKVRGDPGFDELVSGSIQYPPVSLDIPLDGLKSKTEYRLKISAQITIVDIDYDVPTQNDKDTFFTLRKAPTAVIADGDLLATTDSIYMFDVKVDDPDEAILGTVSMIVRNALGVTVFAETLIPNQTYDYTVGGLAKDVTYTITFTASEYNDAFDQNDYTSYRTSMRLKTLPEDDNPLSQKEFPDSPYENCYRITTSENISGRITLRGMDSILGDQNNLNVKLLTELFDQGHNLSHDPKYTLKINARPGYGDYELNDTLVYAFDYGDMVDDAFSEIRAVKLEMYLQYRVELWVTLGGRELMLDQCYFDTDGPMLTISRPEQLRWLNNGTEALDDDTPENIADDIIYNGSLGVTYPRSNTNDRTPYNGGVQSRYGRYLVVADLVHTAASVGTGQPNGNGQNAFQGLIDFQGHTLDFAVHTGSYEDPANTSRWFIYAAGVQSVVRNLVIDYKLTGENPGETRSPIYSNRGRIENVQVRVSAYTERYNVNMNPLVNYNEISGVIENFTVDLMDGMYGRASFGGICYANRGRIQNGYVYSSTRPNNRAVITVPVVPGAENTMFTAQDVGSVAGINTATGRISGVYVLADVYVHKYGTTNRTVNPNRIGTVVGYNENGKISNVYGVGEVYFNTASNPAMQPGINPNNLAQNYFYGPAVGTQAAAARTSAYYVAADPLRTYSNAYNLRGTVDSLRDSAWQTARLGKAFETDKTVKGGFYPHITFPYGMPAQPYLPLPAISAVDTVEVTNVVIEEQKENYAVALVVIKNKSYYKITDFELDGVKAQVLDNSQIDAGGVSRVRVRLEQPSMYKSSYAIKTITYRLLNNYSQYFTDTVKGLSADAEFYKPVASVDDWKKIETDLTSNYRLTKDLDLSALTPQEVMIGSGSGTSYSNVMFTGRLDGGIYDDDYKLIGERKLTGIDLSQASGAAYPGVISELWGGTVSNLRVEGLRINVPNDSYVGFVRYTYAGAKIDNVHILNAEMQGRYYVGGLVGYQSFCDVTNSSTTNLKLRDSVSDDFAAGGLAGLMTNASTIYNSYVYGLEITEERAQNMRGVGGIVGRFEAGEVANVYAQGKITVKSMDASIGGLIGYRPGTDQLLENGWADVTIRVRKDNAGGIIGSNGTTTDFSDMNVLALGSVSSVLMYDPQATDRSVRRIVGTAGGNNEAVGFNGPIAGAFAYLNQRINSLPYDDWADGVQGPGRDGATMASPDDLKSKRYYIMRVRMGNEFVYDKEEFDAAGFGGVAEGYLPLLRRTDGGLLPYQTPHVPTEALYDFDVLDAVYNDQDNDYNVTIDVTHPAGVKIERLLVEDLSIPEAEITNAFNITQFSQDPGNTQTRVILTFKPAWLDRFVDTYAITGVALEGMAPGEYDEAAAQIVFDPLNVPYLDIPTAQDWLEKMASDKHGQTYENIRITGDLDFTALNASLPTAADVRVNRLSGMKMVNGAPARPTVKGIDLTFAQTGMGFVKNVNALLENISFEDITISQTPAGGEYTGIVSKATGTVANLHFEDVYIESNGSSMTGMIGFLRGMALNITLKDIRVDATRRDTQTMYGGTANAKVVSNQADQARFVGGFLGYGIDSILDNITLTYDSADHPSPPGENDKALTGNPNWVWGRYMVGGIVGRLDTSRFSHCSAEYVSVYSETFNGTATSANDSYVGAIAGYATVSGNEPRNERHVVRHARIVAEGNNAGGLFGFGVSFSLSNEPSTVDDTIIIAAGNGAGGAVGNHYTTQTETIVTNVKVFGRARVGGIFGNGTSYWNPGMTVRDSVISTIYDTADDARTGHEAQFTAEVMHDPDGAALPDTRRMIPIKSSNNNFIGGIMASGRVYDGIVVNCIVGATDADYVGGLVGHMNVDQHIARNEVLDTEVSGRDHVGGIVGIVDRNAVQYNVTNAKVNGRYNVGGIVGTLRPDQALYGSNAAQLQYNIFAGEVKGDDSVGGLVGSVTGNLYPIPFTTSYNYANNSNVATTVNVVVQNDRDNHMLGKVWSRIGARASLLYNLDNSITADRVDPVGNRVWEYSVLKIGGTATYAKDLMKSANKPLYKYASRDGNASDGTRMVDDRFLSSDPDRFDEPLYSARDLLLTRDHLTGDYRAQAQSGIANANTESLVRSNVFVRQIWRHSGSRSESHFWHSGIKAGYIPYGTTEVRWYASADPTGTSGYRTQATSSGGKTPEGAYRPVPQTAWLENESIWKPVTGTRIPLLTAKWAPGPNWVNATYSAANYQGGIPIPANPDGAAALGIFGAILGDGAIPPATPEPYVTGADKLNIDFVTSGSALELEAGAYYRIVTEDVESADADGAGTVDAAGDGGAGSNATDGSGVLGGIDGGAGVLDADGIGGLDDDGRRILAGGSLTQRTYTFDYDYKTPLVVVTGNAQGEERETEIDPEDLRRTVMVQGEYRWNIGKAGVFAAFGDGSGDADADGDEPYLTGGFLNMKAGEALNAKGEVYDLATRARVRTVRGLASGGEILPLHTFEYEGVTVKTYRTYSAIGEEGITQDLRLYVKDGKLEAVDPGVPVIYDAILFDTIGVADAKDKANEDADGAGAEGNLPGGESETGEASGGAIESGIGKAGEVSSGAIGDTIGGAPVKSLPDGSEIMTVIDEDGILFDMKTAIALPKGFNKNGIREMTDAFGTDSPIVMVRYETGQAAAFNYATGESLPVPGNEGDTLLDYAAKILRQKKDSDLGDVFADYAALREAEAALKKAGELTSEKAGDPGDATQESLSGETRVDPAVSGKDVIGDSGIGLDSETPAQSGGADETVPPAGGAGGDLSRPTANAAAVSVYNYETGKYEIYTDEALLGETAPAPVTEMDVKTVADQRDLIMGEGGILMDGHSINKGVVALAAIVTAILSLLIVINVKRRKLTR